MLIGQSRVGHGMEHWRGWLALLLALAVPVSSSAVTLPASSIREQAARWMGDLAPTLVVGAQEQAAWLNAMTRFAERVERDDFGALFDFLEHFPQGAWAGPVRIRLAEELYLTGHYRQAVSLLEGVWADRRSNPVPGNGVAYVRGGTRLAEYYARLGLRDNLEGVLAELEPLQLMPADLETVRGIQQGLAFARANPDLASRCGTLALERIRVSLNPTNAGHAAAFASRSTQRGMSLAEVSALALRMGMNYRPAYRSPGSALITPAVMHLQIGHYVAALKQQLGKIRVEDPTGWQTTFFTSKTIDDESSGYFLVPDGRLPAGWRWVDTAEAAEVFGRNGVLENDPDGAGKRDVRRKCGGNEGNSATDGASSLGLATWDAHLMLVSQEIIDTPIGYEPPFGPPIYVTMRFTQRSNERFAYRPSWTHSWSGQIFEDPRTPLGDLWIQEEGGWERFVSLDEEGLAYQGPVFNVGRLVRSSETNVIWNFPDGTKRIYTTFLQRPVLWGRIFYLTGIEDAAGNRVSIQVLPNGRVESLTDPLGRVTRFYYELPDPGIPPSNDPLTDPVTANLDYTNQVTRITDPFGRTAPIHYLKTQRFVSGFCGGVECLFRFYRYDPTNIVDVANLSSTFAYDGSGFWIDKLTTPYGTTSFHWVSGFGGRYSLEITDPEGATERIEFGGPSSVEDGLWQLPKGMMAQSGSLSGREVLHWDKEAYARAYRPGSGDGATAYAFQLNETFSTAGRVLEGIKPPLEGRYWFNYPNQGSPLLPGVGNKPSRIGRLLDDGTTQLWQIDRDPWGNIVRAVDPVGRTTLYVYANNYLDLMEVRQVHGNAQELLLSATYNDHHQPLSITDAAGQTTRYIYNTRGQMTQFINPRGEITQFEFDPNGFLSAVDGPLPGPQDRTTLTYDANGRVRAATDPDGYQVVFDYDALDRITKMTFPDNTTRTLTYDRLDLGSVTDRLGRQTRYTYDGLRRVTAIQDALGQTTRFQWCGCGNLSALIDPLGQMTRWDRDVQGRVIAREFADGKRVSYDYEKTTGRISRVRDGQNQLIEFKYDAADELIQKRYLSARIPTADVSFAYDNAYRRLTSMTDGEGTTTLQYHPVQILPALGAGRLAAVDGPWTNDAVTYRYDELGRVSERAINGVAAQWTYDPAGRLSRVVDTIGTIDVAWDGGTRRLAGLLYPNGQRAEYAYHGVQQDHRLQRITHFLPGGAKLSEFTYTQNAEDQIQQWTQLQGGQLRTWAAGYDALDRLTNLVETLAAGPVTAYDYTYDAAGNRLGERINGDQRQFLYNAVNQLTAISSNVPVPAMSYEWDPEDRLAAVTRGAQRTEFRYDGVGRRTRIIEKTNGVITRERRYLWCGTALCEERDATGGVVLKRFAGAGFRAESGAEVAPGNYFYTRDHLTSIRELVDGAGAVRASYGYSPTGVRTRLSGAVETDFGFSGHLLHAPSGLLLALYRPYDPRLGRWLSRDPVGETAGVNLYAYVRGNPINLIDPFGLDESRPNLLEVDTGSKTANSVLGTLKKLWDKTSLAKKTTKPAEEFYDGVETAIEVENDADKIRRNLGDCDIARRNDPSKNTWDDLKNSGKEGAEIFKTLNKWLKKALSKIPGSKAVTGPATELGNQVLDTGAQAIDASGGQMGGGGHIDTSP